MNIVEISKNRYLKEWEGLSLAQAFLKFNDTPGIFPVALTLQPFKGAIRALKIKAEEELGIAGEEKPTQIAARVTTPKRQEEIDKKFVDLENKLDVLMGAIGKLGVPATSPVDEKNIVPQVPDEIG